jgi:hypothetical protein
MTQLGMFQLQVPKDKSDQQQHIYELLLSKEWVTLPEIMDLRIANYRARISELREQGYHIECETEWVNGVRHSKYRLTRP